jgi:hypothetical protein
MSPEKVLEHANTIRTLVLGAEGRVIPTRAPRTPPHGVYRSNARGRKAWLDRAAIELAREPRTFGED